MKKLGLLLLLITTQSFASTTVATNAQVEDSLRTEAIGINSTCYFNPVKRSQMKETVKKQALSNLRFTCQQKGFQYDAKDVSYNVEKHSVSTVLAKRICISKKMISYTITAKGSCIE
jgi:hypothetical protein